MISNSYANKILNLICGVSDALQLPSTMYLGLCSAEPNASTGAITGEPTAASYERVPIGGSTNGLKKYFGSASGGIISNAEEIKFNVARESFGTMNYFFLSESASGNAILWGAITGGVTINAETVPVFYEGDLKASIDVEI